VLGLSSKNPPVIEEQNRKQTFVKWYRVQWRRINGGRRIKMNEVEVYRLIVLLLLYLYSRMEQLSYCILDGGSQVS
jgi:hypothetical protein